MTILSAMAPIYDQIGRSLSENGIAAKSVNLAIRMNNSDLQMISIHWQNFQAVYPAHKNEIKEINLNELLKMVENGFGSPIQVCQLLVLLDSEKTRSNIGSDFLHNSKNTFIKEENIGDTRVIIQILLPLI